MTTITMRIPVNVVESLKQIAPHKGFTGYQTLLKSYISEGLRRDEAEFSGTRTTRLIEALRRHGVPAEVLDEAARDLEVV
ncbi:MAG: BrnA antitoxin family protein [Candidatus Thiosymbion ectosymbiont of Robbea hypermnestra]|nr:BrnA antitoxin family protein [Candidatus Thiosymbion ectosymbiont of Robbea hypermnestra]